MNLKGEMSMLNVLHLENTDVDTLSVELQRKRDEMPQFFMQSPVVVDCSLLGEDAEDFDFSKLKEALLKLNFIPIGIRNCPVECNGSLRKAGWAIMRESRKPANDVIETKEEAATETSSDDDIYDLDVDSLSAPNSTSQAANEVPEETQNQKAFVPDPAVKMNKSLTVDKPVRSGQQIYAADSDMTVLAATSAGSEIMADGSIHVYGALRGRVLAGALGNESARIFCQSLQAELIAIAGRYQLLDESDTQLIGKPAMIKLVGEKLVIEPLFPLG